MPTSTIPTATKSACTGQGRGASRKRCNPEIPLALLACQGFLSSWRASPSPHAPLPQCRKVAQPEPLPFLLPGFTCAFSPALVVPGLGLKIARTTIMTLAAAGAVTAIAPGARLDRAAVAAAKPLSRRWHFEAQLAPFRAISGPPAAPQDRTPMSLAQPLPGWWHFFGPIAFRAARGAMASAPIARPDRPAVNLAQPFVARTAALLYGFSSIHGLSITQLRV